MTLLLLETATPVCSVALWRDGHVLAQRASSEQGAHSSMLSPYINQVMEEASLRPVDLSAVCVSSGPGSYTGLRIGVSTAKGICYALSIPLLSVPTLQSMAAHYYALHPDYQGLVCPMIDARRMECYAAIFDRSLEEVKPTGADIIESGIYDIYLNNNSVVFVGDGSHKVQPVLGVHPNARFDDTFTPSAAGMADLACRHLQEGRVEDTAYFVPFYLKDFIAKKPVVKGLHK